jgi:hypothetical protein
MRAWAGFKHGLRFVGTMKSEPAMNAWFTPNLEIDESRRLLFLTLSATPGQIDFVESSIEVEGLSFPQSRKDRSSHLIRLRDCLCVLPRPPIGV